MKTAKALTSLITVSRIAARFIGLDRGLVLRFLFYALIEFCVLLLRTRRLEKNRRLSRRCCAIAFVVVVPVSVGMLYVFMMKFNE